MVNNKRKIGLGSLSFLLCIIGILFTFTFAGHTESFGDVVIRTIGLKTWSNGAEGTHYTIYYSSIFYITSIIMGLKFKKDIGSTLGIIISSILLVLLLFMFFMSVRL
jgi:hypothetical protein